MDEKNIIFKINPTLKITEIYLIFALLALFLTFKNIYFGIVSLLFFVLAARAAIVRKLAVFSLTDEYVSSRTGLISKKIVSIPISRIQNVSLRMKFSQRIINVGEIVVESAGEEEKNGKTKENEVVMSHIDKPEYYYQLIMEKIGRQ